MKATLYDTLGAETGTVDLDAAFFGVTPNQGLMHRLLVLQLANARHPIAHTKHRGEVAGSTRKLFKQKGTGSARMGDRRSPMRRGGGVVFGPRSERNFTLSLSRQERRLALLSLLSTKAATSSVKIIETLSLDGAKTKAMTTLMKAIDASHAVLAVTREETPRVQGAYNLATVKVVNVEYLNPHSLLKYTNLVFTRSSLEHLYTHFSR